MPSSIPVPLLHVYLLRAGLPSWVFIGFVLLVILLLMMVAIQNKLSEVTPRGHWHNSFINVELSIPDLYNEIEENVKQLNIPGVSTSRVTYHEGGMLSSKREYLRVTRNHLVFDICAAPFGPHFFISWWQGEAFDEGRKFVLAIPFIGKTLEGIFYPQTYYSIDTRHLFQSTIHRVLSDAVNTVTKGAVRGFVELERKSAEANFDWNGN